MLYFTLNFKLLGIGATATKKIDQLNECSKKVKVTESNLLKWPESQNTSPVKQNQGSSSWK